MTNKIDGPGPGVQPPAPGRPDNTSQANRAEAARTDRKPRPQDSARVEVTDQALRMKRLEDKIMSMPAVDEARVDAVRERLASGEYAPDRNKIADKLIRYEKDFE